VDGRTDRRTDGWTFPPLMLSDRLGGVDLIREITIKHANLLQTDYSEDSAVLAKQT